MNVGVIENTTSEIKLRYEIIYQKKKAKKKFSLPIVRTFNIRNTSHHKPSIIILLTIL